jgi:hypothetical protein
MNRFAIAMLGAAAGLAAIASPVTCAAPSPSDVASPGFSYSCGGLTFSDFSVTNAGSQPVGQVNIGNSFYEDMGGTRRVTLNLNPNLTLPPGSAGDAAVRLWYTVTTAGAINRVGGIMPQSGNFLETLCTASFGGGTSCGGTQLDQFTVTGPSNTTQWGTQSFSQGAVYVYKQIGGPAPIHTTALSQVFDTSVPEPASMLLIGTGLLATALLGRRGVRR